MPIKICVNLGTSIWCERLPTNRLGERIDRGLDQKACVGDYLVNSGLGVIAPDDSTLRDHHLKE